ncbi:MAG: radical SAM protein [Alphaproteobacteria bacterium]|nr:radical SAM protein [Alphaproteobacteria bacterium]
MSRPDIALLFPPQWYFAAVPADLSHTAGTLRSRGRTVVAWDGSAALLHAHLGDHPALRAYRDPATFADPARHAAAEDALYAETRRLSVQYGCDWGPRHLRFPDTDEADVPRALLRGRDPFRNPALPLLEAVANDVIASGARVAAIALVHPDQRVQALTLASLLRPRHARVILYGCLEDVLAPTDFAEALLGDHALWDVFHGVVLGDADDALDRLCDAQVDAASVPNLLVRGMTALPARVEQSLSAPADFSDVRREHHLAPSPVVDLRLGRGCPWGRCRFCGIQAHHPGYRAGPLERVVESMRRAHDALGSTVFRVRDDLLTPRQLRELGEATRALPFRPRWMARARFTSGLTADTLRTARDGGLEELWLGLESAVPRVRALMDKGVEQDVVLRGLDACATTGIRARLLCMVGYPGETEAEARQTVAFLRDHPTAGFSVTPFMEVGSAPLSSAPAPDTRTRIDHVVPHAPPAWLGSVMEEAVALGASRASPGPDPVHRWLSDLASG